MDPKKTLEIAKTLLKAAKENPSGFGDLAKVNPDEKADAKLGEEVEHVVESHMSDNKEAEAKEGHKICKDDMMGSGGAMAMKEMIKDELKSDFKPRFKSGYMKIVKDELQRSTKPKAGSEILSSHQDKAKARAPAVAESNSWKKNEDCYKSIMEKWEPKFYKSAEKVPGAKPVYSPKMIKPSDVKESGPAGMAIPNPAPKKRLN